MLAEEVDAPEAPKIAPGPYSGPSKSNGGVCEIANEERKGNIKETKPLTTSGYDALASHTFSFLRVLLLWFCYLKKLLKQTVTSRIAQWGTYILQGQDLGTTMHGVWPIELKVWIQCYQIR